MGKEKTSKVAENQENDTYYGGYLPEVTATYKVPKKGINNIPKSIIKKGPEAVKQYKDYMKSFNQGRAEWGKSINSTLAQTALAPWMLGNLSAGFAAKGLPFLKDLVIGTGASMLGGAAVNKGTEVATGKKFDDYLNGYASYLNPGYYLNPVAGGKAYNMLSGIPNKASTIARNVKNNYDIYKHLEGGWYSGVPNNKVHGQNYTMAENFPNFKGTVWASNNPDYGRQFAVSKGGVHPDGQVYQIFFDPRKLKFAEAPKPPNSKTGYAWRGLPFRFRGNKIEHFPSKEAIVNGYKAEYPIMMDTAPMLHPHSILGVDAAGDLVFKNTGVAYPRVTTDVLVEQARQRGFDGTRFYNIADGGIFPKEAYTFTKEGEPTIDFDVVNKASEKGKSFINEVVLNPGVQRYNLKEGESKWHLLKQFNWLH